MCWQQQTQSNINVWTSVYVQLNIHSPFAPQSTFAQATMCSSLTTTTTTPNYTAKTVMFSARFDLLLCFNRDVLSYILYFGTRNKSLLSDHSLSLLDPTDATVRTNKSSWSDESKQKWSPLKMVQLDDCELSSQQQRHGYTVRWDSGKRLQINCCWRCTWWISCLLFIKYAAPYWLAATPPAVNHHQGSE